MDTWIGDWMEDDSKIVKLTPVRACQDIYLMMDSPDYDDDDVDKALDIASDHFGYTKMYLFTFVLGERHHAHKMSQV